MPLSTIFQLIPVWWGSVEETGVTTDLPQGADKLDHNAVSSTPRH